ncbi:uncharacterized protein LOC120704476 isoform X2 [Panicum virgatum]|uniref:uncharacterized protein LOC120704476 isoform X2 n=1 Tax=Panicum virgatum TaxID=38727 RepID=UPI0019D669F6|nr:uncharacterized protein LOC120704476 isoform X2 [Panicum virgatum]
MERSRGEAGAPTPPTPAAAAAAGAGGGAAKGMSCKGCLFYSSVLRSRERGPVCVGITRALPQVSGRMIGEIKPEHSKGDCQFRDLSYFKYACVGYSIYLDDKETSVGVHEKAHEQLPVCFGAELLNRIDTSQGMQETTYSPSFRGMPGLLPMVWQRT